MEAFTFRSGANEDRYAFLSDILAHTLHYVDDKALFDEFCSKRAVMSVRIALSTRRAAAKDVATYDNYVITDKRQLTIDS